MNIVDPPSAMGIMLPSAPTVDNSPTTATNGNPGMPNRTYTSELSDGRGQVLFSVTDTPDTILDLNDGLRGAVSASNGTLTSTRHLEIQGHPAVDGRFTIPDQGDGYVGLMRVIADRGHVVSVESYGSPGEESALSQAQEQALSTLHLI